MATKYHLTTLIFTTLVSLGALCQNTPQFNANTFKRTRDIETISGDFRSAKIDDTTAYIYSRNNGSGLPSIFVSKTSAILSEPNFIEIEIPSEIDGKRCTFIKCVVLNRILYALCKSEEKICGFELNADRGTSLPLPSFSYEARVSEYLPSSYFFTQSENNKYIAFFSYTKDKTTGKLVFHCMAINEKIKTILDFREEYDEKTTGYCNTAFMSNSGVFTVSGATRTENMNEVNAVSWVFTEGKKEIKIPRKPEKDRIFFYTGFINDSNQFVHYILTNDQIKGTINYEAVFYNIEDGSLINSRKGHIDSPIGKAMASQFITETGRFILVFENQKGTGLSKAYNEISIISFNRNGEKEWEKTVYKIQKPSSNMDYQYVSTIVDVDNDTVHLFFLDHPGNGSHRSPVKYTYKGKDRANLLDITISPSGEIKEFVVHPFTDQDLPYQMIYVQPILPGTILLKSYDLNIHSVYFRFATIRY